MICGEENDSLFMHLRELEESQRVKDQFVGQSTPASVDSIADQLALHFPHVVILVATKDIGADETVLKYAWRGGYYPARGMVHRLLDIMRAGIMKNRREGS